MNRNTFFRYWPVTIVLAGIAFIAILALGTSPAQAFHGNRSETLQETPLVTTIPATAVPAATVIIPNTGGGDTFIVSFFSNFVLWAVLGLLVIVVLISLLARPRGPDIHHDV